MQQKSDVITFGCRLNAHESESIKQLANAHNIQNTVFINTCSVTREADRQARQTIRRIKRETPDVNIVVTGCSAQNNPDAYAKMKEVSFVWGNHDKLLPSSYEGLKSGTLNRTTVSDISEIKETAHHLVDDAFDGKVRAFLPVQNGCDHRCTFCNIPFARGPSRSVPIGGVIEQVRNLLTQCEEIVLTGVDITSYGHDLPGKPSLGSMIKRVLQHVPNLGRLRLSSIDPAEVDDELWHLIESEPRLMPHLHLSVQAGADMILKRMKRRHLRQDVIDTCKRAQSLRPDLVIGADIIAGFPTETDKHFQDSLNLVEEANITLLHVFPYSSREDTPAARMPSVPKAIAKERAEALRQKGSDKLEALFKSLNGTHQRVLIEQYKDGVSVGKTDHFLPVHINETLEGVVNVRIIGFEKGYLLASSV